MKYRNYTIKVRPARGQIKADVYRSRSYITSLFGPTRARAVERAELFVEVTGPTRRVMIMLYERFALEVETIRNREGLTG